MTSSKEYNVDFANSEETDSGKLVSIVLATYNGEAYLVEQLESLFKQTYPNIEIVATDDCSTDQTVEILREQAKMHPNMKVFVNESNLGFIKNFEKGCTLATGDLIAFCDQDDYWEPDKIEKMVGEIGDHAVIYHDSVVCDENMVSKGMNISDLVHFKSWNNCLQLAVFCRIYAHTMLFKKSFFEKAYPFLSVIPPDWWLPYLSTFYGGMKYLPEPLVKYRQHQQNVTGVVGGKSKKNKQLNRSEKKRKDLENIRTRVNTFYEVCPEELVKEKAVLLQLKNCYADFSFVNNMKRVSLFLKYRDTFLSVKKHSAVHRFFFCFKMFYKIK